MGPIPSWEYHDLLVASLRERCDIEILTFADEIRYDDKNYPFTRIASRGTTPDDPVLVLRFSYHGNEPLGAMTFLHQPHRIVDEIHGRGAKFIAYPMPDPSGFELGVRGGLAGNDGYDDWLRYELGSGTIVDELRPYQPFKRWFWSSDPCLAKLGVTVNLSQETALMHQCLRHDLTRYRITSAVDVHQHTYVKGGDDLERVTKPGMYFYGFGGWRKRAVYDQIVDCVDRRVPVLRNTWIAAGYDAPAQTDDQGCIVAHDGSFADACMRAGVPYSTALETTGATPDSIAEELVLEWIIGNAEIAKRTRMT